MKTFRLVMLTITLFFGVVLAQVSELPIGSPERVMEWSLENSDELNIRIVQGNLLVVKLTVGQSFPKLKSKEELDSYFETKLTIAAKWALTNRWQNRDQPFRVIARVSRYYDEFPQLVNLFMLDDQFSLIKLGDGSYRLPDLSSMKVEIPSGVQVLIPGIKWARIESGETILNSSIEPIDSLVWKSWGLLIPLDIAMSPDTTVRLISGTNYTYQVFGPDGKPQVEEPVRLVLGSYPQNTSASQAKKASESDTFKVIEIRGGGVGRVLQLQQTSTPQGPWQDIKDGEFTRWTGEPIFKSVATATDMSFYRVRSVKKIPTYGD